ncbi:HET-domain-containing protein [Thozetella sp. PMI_491]|nr:HET-domain-containing protein [Thozetella sp. PMI_491]
MRGHISLDIGYIDQLLSSECSRHNILLQRFSKELRLAEPGTFSIWRDIFSSSFSFSVLDKNIAADSRDYGRQTPPFDLLGPKGLGVDLNPSWIGEEVLQQWYSDCITDHGEKCSSPQYLQLLPSSRPDYFIDTAANCLVSARANAPYAALSYVWGQIKMLNVTAANLIRLQQPGAFEDPVIRKDLPRTVLHAIYLTKRLKGLRYLWVDALCIVQDDEEIMNTHLVQMGSIYANASIVITNMDGKDADHGLRGLQGAPGPVPRQIEQSAIPFGDRTFVERLHMGNYRYLSKRQNLYLERGWTFQEHFFARRCICFENDSVWFQCCRSIEHEDHKKPDLPKRERDWILDVGYPSITVLSRLIGDFNRRQLSFPQDCLLAIAGIAPCYTKIFTGGFVSGLPEMFIDAMLLWQPASDLVQRISSSNTNKPLADLTNTCLPSWSWAGWQGDLDFDGWCAANDFVAACSGWIAPASWEIVSTTTWYACNTPNGEYTRKINCLWAEWRERYKDHTEELPEGWTKRLKKEGQRLTCETPPDGYGKYLYRFEGSRSDFWYPLPLSDPTGVPRADANVAYLCGQVQTAHAYTLGSVLPKQTREYERKGEYSCISLRNNDGKWIGILRLHSADYLEKEGVALGEEGHKVQLIAISGGFVPNGLGWHPSYIDEYEMDERPSEGPRYEFINVLWVSWDGAVARREALGRVVKQYWEELGATTIDIVLG